MQRLSDLQRDFAGAVMRPERPVPSAVTSHTGARLNKRFNVYRNNIAISLTGVLEGRFPVVKRLVGGEYFAALARAYMEAHPPRSPVLMEYGADFADFLEGFEPVAELPYLGGVARIEWAWSVAYYAADAVPLTPRDLSAVAEANIPALVLRCHPSLGIVSSPYPVLSIWRTNTDDEDVKPVDLSRGGEDALVVRPDMEVTVRSLPEGASAFISAIRAGATLAEANGKAIARAPGFDLQRSLAGFIRAGAITDFSISNRRG